MLSVWIHSPSQLVAKALGELVTSLGYRVQFEEHPEASLALWDLSCCDEPYTPAPAVPALALLSGSEDDLTFQSLSALGYRNVLLGGDIGNVLKDAFASLVPVE